MANPKIVDVNIEKKEKVVVVGLDEDGNRYTPLSWQPESGSYEPQAHVAASSIPINTPTISPESESNTTTIPVNTNNNSSSTSNTGPVRMSLAVSGLEFAKDHPYSKPDEWKYNWQSKEFYDKHNEYFDHYRVAFLGSRMFNVDGSLKPEYAEKIDKNIDWAKGQVWLDSHDYARRAGKQLGSSEFTFDTHMKSMLNLVLTYKDNDKVECIEVDNEPHDLEIGRDGLYDHYFKTAKKMQQAGWNKLIGVPIYSWSQMDNYFGIHPGGHGEKLKALAEKHGVDMDKIRIIFHNYFDAGNKGFDHPQRPNMSAEKHVEILDKTMEDVEKSGMKVAVTEIGVPNTQEWIDNAKPFVARVKNKWSHLITHLMYWADGEWYSSQTDWKDTMRELMDHK